jgi:hypothetical protein
MEVIYKYSCEKCNFKCQYESQWNIHINTELHKTGIKKKRSDIKEPYICDKCDKCKTKNLYTYKQHILNEHSKKEEREKGFKYYCKLCDFGTFSITFIENHNKSEKHMKQIERNK